MIRRFCVVSMCVAFCLPGSVRAENSFKNALSVIPADAMAFVCVPSLHQLDVAYQQVVEDLGLQMMVPPTARSLVALIRQNLPFAEAIDENAALAIVIMPAGNVFELQAKLAFIVTAKDPKAMLEAMGATQGEGDVWSAMLFGKPVHALIKGKRVILGMTAAVTKAIAASTVGIDTKLKPEELKGFDGLNVALWVDADKLFTLLKPQIDMMLPFMLMAQGGGADPFAAQKMEMTKKQIDVFVDGAASLTLGLALDKSGMRFRIGMRGKEGSKFAESLQVRNTTDSLLTGLAADDYVVSLGGTIDPGQMKATIESLNDYCDLAGSAEGADKEKIGQIKSIIAQAAPLVTDFRFALQAIAPGEFGLFSIAAIVETKDATKFMELKGKAFGLIKDMIASSGGLGDDDLKRLAEAVEYLPNVEEIAGAKVSHYKVDLSKVEELEEEDIEEINKVIGKEGILIRFAAADANSVVAVFGGGTAQMAKLIELARKKLAPLDADSGIKRVAAQMAKDRYLVGYLAIDRAMKVVKNVMIALDEEPFPIQIPPLELPLTFTGTGGSGWSQMDFLAPTEVLVAIKNAAMMMMGSAMGQPQPSGTTPPQDAEQPVPPVTPEN